MLLVREAGREVQLCVERGTFPPHERIRFRRTVCAQAAGKLGEARCRPGPTGTARVVQKVDARCASVLLPTGADVRPGDAVEVIPAVDP